MNLNLRSIKPFTIYMSLTLSLVACGEPVLNANLVDTSQSTPLVQADLSPGSKGPQEISGRLRVRTASTVPSSAQPRVTGYIQFKNTSSQQVYRAHLDAEGRFRLPANLPDGDYEQVAYLQSAQLNYQETYPVLSIRQGKSSNSLELETYLVSLTGRVTLEGQNTANGVTVKVSGLNLSGQTNHQGNFDLGLVPAVLLKNRELHLSSPNFGTVNQTLANISELSTDAFSSSYLKSIIPLSNTSVLQHLAGKVQIETRQLTGAPEGMTIPDWNASFQQVMGGFADGPAHLSQFNRPGAMVQDASGALLIADTNNHRIRKLSPQGHTQTLAGNDQAGLRDSIGTVASFNYPNGLALSSQGDLYISDTGNHAIRILDAQQNVTTLSGGQAGYADGPLANARFNLPTDLASDAQGNLFVLDLGNQAIRKITPAGQVETVYRSSWKATPLFQQMLENIFKYPDYSIISPHMQGPENAQLMFPRHLALAPNGDLFVSDAANSLIFRIQANGQPEYYAGNSRLVMSGSQSANRPHIYLSNPQAMTVDPQGILFLSDQSGIYQIPAQGVIVKLVSTSSIVSSFDNQELYVKENIFVPGGLILHTDGSLSLSDRASHQIYRLDPCDRHKNTICSQEPFFRRSGIPDTPFPGFYPGETRWGKQANSWFFPIFTAPVSYPLPAQTRVLEPISQEASRTYLIRIENRSQDLHFGSGALQLSTSPLNPVFEIGQPLSDYALEAYAEDGDIEQLQIRSSQVDGLINGIQTLGLGFTSPEIAPSQTLETLTYPGNYLQLWLKLNEANDTMIALNQGGLHLDKIVTASDEVDITDYFTLLDSGTEVNEPLGQGANQVERQPYPNAGQDEGGVVHMSKEPGMPAVKDLLRVTIRAVNIEEFNRIQSQLATQSLKSQAKGN